MSLPDISLESIDDEDERREELIKACEELSGEEIIKVLNYDTGEADYTPIWVAHTSMIEMALSDDNEQATLIDEVQYMSEAI